MTYTLPTIHTNLQSPHTDVLLERMLIGFENQIPRKSFHETHFWTMPQQIYVEFNPHLSLVPLEKSAVIRNPHHSFGKQQATDFHNMRAKDLYDLPHVTVVIPGEGPEFWLNDDGHRQLGRPIYQRQREQAAWQTMHGITGQTISDEPFTHVLAGGLSFQSAVSQILYRSSTDTDDSRALDDILVKPIIQRFNTNWNLYQRAMQRPSNGPQP